MTLKHSHLTLSQHSLYQQALFFKWGTCISTCMTKSVREYGLNKDFVLKRSNMILNFWPRNIDLSSMNTKGFLWMENEWDWVNGREYVVKDFTLKSDIPLSLDFEIWFKVITHSLPKGSVGEVWVRLGKIEENAQDKWSWIVWLTDWLTSLYNAGRVGLNKLMTKLMTVSGFLMKKVS